MQIVIEGIDWRRLSSGAREELLQLLEEPSSSAPARQRTAVPADNNKGFRWRVPFDLTADLGRKLLRGLTDDQLKRLNLFAKGDGRVSLKTMLAATKGADLHVLSAFEGAITRKLRRLVGDDVQADTGPFRGVDVAAVALGARRHVEAGRVGVVDVGAGDARP